MPDQEQPRELVFAALLPAAQLAIDSPLSLREFKQLAELACYRELKRRRLTMKKICRRIGVSMGKVGQLSRELKEHFSRPDTEYGLPRRLLALMRAGPQTEAKLSSGLRGDRTRDVSQALANLLDQGLIEEVPGRTVRYRIRQAAFRQVREPWLARVDALTDLMSSIANVIAGRFIHSEEDAFARTLSFRVRQTDMPRLKALYEEHIFPLVAELDAQAESDTDSDAEPLKLSIVWAPDSGENLGST